MPRLMLVMLLATLSGTSTAPAAAAADATAAPVQVVVHTGVFTRLGGVDEPPKAQTSWPPGISTS